MYYKVSLKVSTNEIVNMVSRLGPWQNYYYTHAIEVERRRKATKSGMTDIWKGFEIKGSEIDKLLEELIELGKQWWLLGEKVKEDKQLLDIKDSIRNKAGNVISSLWKTTRNIRKSFIEEFYHSIIEPLFSSPDSPLFLTPKIKDIWSILAEDGGSVALPIKDGYVVINAPEVALTNTCEQNDIDYLCTDYHIDLILDYNGSKRGTIEIYLNNPATATEVLERLASMSNKFASITTTVETENNTC
jgi:hypothetical protein